MPRQRLVIYFDKGVLQAKQSAASVHSMYNRYFINCTPSPDFSTTSQWGWSDRKPKNMGHVRKKIFWENLTRCNIYDLDFVEVILPVPIKDTMLVAHKYYGGRSKAAGIIFVRYLSCLPTSFRTEDGKCCHESFFGYYSLDIIEKQMMSFHFAVWDFVLKK